MGALASAPPGRDTVGVEPAPHDRSPSGPAPAAEPGAAGCDPGAGPSLEARLAALGAALQATFGRLLASALPGSPSREALRPGALVTTLGLDKSLAGRVVRAVQADAPLAALHASPTPQGLGLVLDAARARVGATSEHAAAAAARERFAALLAEFPGGRGDLEAALTGWLPEQRADAERQARREVFRGMSVIAGVRSESFYTGYFLAPSATPGRLDTAWVLTHQRLRRLSVGSSFVFGGYASSPGPDTARERRMSLGGIELARDPAQLLLPEFCSAPLHTLDVLQGPDRVALRLGRSEPRVNEPITLALGAATLDHHPLRADATRSYVYMTAGVRAPTERLVIDLVVHDDVATGDVPLATRGSDYVTELKPETTPGDLGADAFVPGLTFEDLGRPADVREAEPASAPLAAAVFARRGWDPARFRVYRLREAFPLPTDLTTSWVRLRPR